MKLTAIKAQAKRANQFSIFIDGKYAFSLNETGLLKQKLYVGQELSVAEVKRLKQASSDDKLYGLALRYVLLRPHSEWETRAYLKRKKIPPALVEQILSKLSKLGLLGDRRFAQAWVESRRLLHPTSKRKLQQELHAKHVSNQVISQVLAEDKSDDAEQLRVLIAKKRTRYPDNLKLMQYLVRQGFSYEDIKAAQQEDAI